jgi:RNA polymerase sigma-70 factor (ECF subfamily)
MVGKPQVCPELLSDGELVTGTLQGNSLMFKGLYDRYSDAIYSLIYYSIKNTHWAEDLLQCVFIKVHRNLPRFRKEASFKTWLYRIAVNEVKNFRRALRFRDLSLEAIENTPAELDWEPSPEAERLQKERRDIVFRAMSDLPDRFRTILILKYVDELSYEEIATVLSMRMGTVASTLNRALTELHRRLLPFENLL